MPSFTYWFSFFKRTTFLFHTPRSGGASSLGAGRLHLVLLTFLGPVSLKQKLSQWERSSTSSLKSIFPSIPLLPWLSRLVLYRELLGCVSFWKGPSYRSHKCPMSFCDGRILQRFLFRLEKWKKNKKMFFFATTSVQTEKHLYHLILDCLIFSFCTTGWKTDFLPASPQPISINNPNNKSKKDSTTPSLTRIASVCCVLVDIIFLLCLIQMHLFFLPSFILLH